MIYLSHKKGVVYVEKNRFSSKLMLLFTMHQLQRSSRLNKKIRHLDHPPYSPDLNSWEILWRLIVDSMPSRNFEVIKANGGSTKYLKSSLYILYFCSLVLYLYQNKILKLSINANIHIKNDLKFLYILSLVVFMSYLSYIWFSFF